MRGCNGGTACVQLMWDARDQVRNNPILYGILHRLAMYCTAWLTYEPNTGNEAMDTMYADYMKFWMTEKEGGKTLCDVTGRHTFRKLIELGFMGHMVDGSYGYCWRPMGKQLKLQAIEADRIGSPLEVRVEEDYIGGFSLGPDGEIVSVKIFERSRLGFYKNPIEWDPAQFLYVDDCDRADQYRGPSKLQVILPHSRDLHELLMSEKAAAKWASSYAGYLLTKSPNSPHSAMSWDGTQSGERTPTMDRGYPPEGRQDDGGRGHQILAPGPTSSQPGAFLAARRNLRAAHGHRPRSALRLPLRSQPPGRCGSARGSRLRATPARLLATTPSRRERAQSGA